MKHGFNNEDLKRVFLDAFNIIKNKEHWTQGFWALNKDGDARPAFSEDAVSWCSSGAIVKAVVGKTLDIDKALHYHPSLDENLIMGELSYIFRKYIKEMPFSGMTYYLYEYNDSHSHEEVLALWKMVGNGEGWL